MARINLNKRAQAQNLETIIVIFVITIIIAISITIFYNLNSKSLDSLKYRLQQNQAYNLLATLPLTPELQYTELSYDRSSIDSSKLISSQLNINSNVKVEIIQLYPKKPDILCNRETYPECSQYILFDNPLSSITNKEIVSIPVQIYHPLSKEKGFANLVITSYY